MLFVQFLKNLNVKKLGNFKVNKCSSTDCPSYTTDGKVFKRGEIEIDINTEGILSFIGSFSYEIP